VPLSHPWSHRQIIAHRGSRVLWPENTMLAFGSSLEAGADHLETDLHLTADGHLVCFHDSTVERTTDGQGPVASFTLKELRNLDAGFSHRIGADFPFRGRGLRVPTLGEVLATFPEVGVVVDLKTDGIEEAVADLLDRMRAWERVIIGSFYDTRLDLMRKLGRGKALLSTGPLAARRWWLASRIGRRGRPGYAALQLPPSHAGLPVVDRRLVEIAHDADMAVHVWTINQPGEMQRLWDIGVDALITDRVDHAVSVLAP